MHYAVIRAILGDNCNMPVKKTPSPGSHGLLLKGAAWLYNDRSARRGEGEGGRAAGEEIFSIWMNRSAALDTMLFWPSQGSCDIMPHSHTVSKIPWGQQLPLPTNKCFCSLYSGMHAKSSFPWGAHLLPTHPRWECLNTTFPWQLLSRQPRVRWSDTGHLQGFPTRVPQVGSRWVET